MNARSHIIIMALCIAFCLSLASCKPPAPKDPQGPAPPTPTADKAFVEEVTRLATPMGEYTSYYQQKEFIVEDEQEIYSIPYYWYIPKTTYSEGMKLPLVLVLHSAGGDAIAGQYLVKNKIQKVFPSFVLVPMVSFYSMWAAPPEAEHSQREQLPNIIKLLQDLVLEYPIDPARIYVIGCSLGGQGALASAYYYPDIFAAAVSHIGKWPASYAKDMTKVPIWAFNGALDKMVPPQEMETLFENIQQFGGDSYMHMYEDMGHECQHEFQYPNELWEWMFSKKKKF